MKLTESLFKFNEKGDPMDDRKGKLKTSKPEVGRTILTAF